MSFTEQFLIRLIDEGLGNSSYLVDLGDGRALADRASEVPEGAILACGHGERGMTAASVLERAGHTGLLVLDGGPDEYAAAHGQTLEQGRPA